MPSFTMTARGTPLGDTLREMWQYRALVGELMRRDLKVRYKNRVGGILWSLATPLLQVLAITITVKYFFANPVKNYSAYLMAVMFVWVFFQSSVLDASASFLHNGALVRKIYFPRAILPLVASLSNLFHFGISLSFTIGYFFWLRTYPQQLSPRILLVIPTVFFLWILALGLGYMMAYLNNLYEDVRFITGVSFQLLFYALPILYPIERVASKPLVYELYLLNPLAVFMVTFQRAVLAPPPVYDGAGHLLSPIGIPWGHFIYACGFSVVMLMAGFALFEKSKWTIMERL